MRITGGGGGQGPKPADLHHFKSQTLFRASSYIHFPGVQT